ncbi:hypothetical protein Nepgr_000930 [Nepenthes gracilis]|uniref:Uncharacterized protein n=1 Tax=Nepenthes gracilis TaxID=150966 RepID=A0AAD3RWX9_NEPGR|nr:hypothetical protein Nepgr_000930 [Nepenthes gracilis]
MNRAAVIAKKFANDYVEKEKLLKAEEQLLKTEERLLKVEEYLLKAEEREFELKRLAGLLVPSRGPTCGARHVIPGPTVEKTPDRTFLLPALTAHGFQSPSRKHLQIHLSQGKKKMETIVRISLMAIFIAIFSLHVETAIAAEAPAPSPTSATGSLSPSSAAALLLAFVAFFFGSVRKI